MSRTDASRAILGAQEIHTHWENDYLNSDLDPFYDRACARLVEKLGAPSGAKILDAGCGYAYHAMRYARLGLHVVGVDFSEAAVRNARTNVKHAGLDDRITVQQADILGLPFPDGSFTYVVSWGVLMHIPEVERALKELVRVLAPGGRIALMENNASSLHVRLWEPFLRGAKRALGRMLPERTTTERGVEEWSHEGDGGGLMVRKTDIRWIERTMRALGADLIDRSAGQFTELYTALPGRALKRLVYRANWVYFLRELNPRLALGNVLVFEKRE